MELNEIERWSDCLQEFGGIPVGTTVNCIRITALDAIREYLEPKNSRVFLLPYYGLGVEIDVRGNIDINMETIPDQFLTESSRKKLGVTLGDESVELDSHYQGAVEVIQALLNHSGYHPTVVPMHRFDDFLIYSETKFGMWELWFHKSGDCSVTHAPKYMDFNAWVEQQSKAKIGVSVLPVPNSIYEIEGTNLLSKFEW